MRKIFLSALFASLATLVFAQTNKDHTHLFDVHCASCDSPLGNLTLIKSASDSVQFLIAKDAIIKGEDHLQCKVCSQHLFDEKDQSGLQLPNQYALTSPLKNNSIVLKAKPEQEINLKNFCPVCHQKLTRKIHPNGYASTTFRWKKVKKLFN